MEMSSGVSTQECSNSAGYFPLSKTFEVFDEINWPFTGTLILGHLLALYGLTQLPQSVWQLWAYMKALNACNILVSFILVAIDAASIVGSHRLWSHRSFKAKTPLKVFFMLFQTPTCQGPIYIWARWHRLHHKYSDTVADPHNPTRGFFYAHIGWIMLYDHQKFQRNAEGEIDSSDLERDEVVMWQYRNYHWLLPLSLLAIVMPPWILGWDSPLNIVAFTGVVILHLTHTAGLINSLAHGVGEWGTRPYDKFIRPTQIFLLNVFVGEGDHNYHHVFPWDYKNSEHASFLNFPAHFIRLSQWMGLAYDLKTASPELVAKRSQRTGDGSQGKSHYS